LPEVRGIKPSYEQKKFERDELRGKWRLVGAKNPSGDAVRIQQDVKLFATILENETLAYPLESGRNAWLQIARGKFEVNGVSLEAGDGVAFSQESAVELNGSGEALLFDLA
jgi:hypothetical protein